VLLISTDRSLPLTTRSGMPSPLKSPTATELGKLPVPKVPRRLEASIPVAQEHRNHVVGAVVSHGQVEQPIAGEL
jgi:hypothetical protein